MNRFFSTRRRFPRVFLAAFALMFLGARAVGGTSSVSMEVDAAANIQMTAVASVWDGLGWMPVNIRIENQASIARSWNFNFTAGNPYGSGWRLGTSAALIVPARSVGELTVFVPGPGARNRDFSIVLAKVEGPGVSSGHNISLTEHGDFSRAYIAVSTAPSEEVRRMVTPAPRSGSGSASIPTPAHEVQPIEPLRWPADWRVWTAFSSIVLSQDEFNSLDGARRNALREWVAQGGCLWLDQTAASEGKPNAPTSLGAGKIYTGLSRLLEQSTDASLRLAPWKKNGELLTDLDRNDWALSKPIVALIIFLIIFGIVVGPLNAFFFAPAAKRHRLFVTVPVLSIAASVLLGVVIVLVDGFGGEGVRRAQVMLIPGENKAVVFQQQIARTGVLLNRSFPLPKDTLLGAGSERSSGVDSVEEMERNDEVAGGAWFSSRATQSHDLRRITPTRARVELVDGGVGGSDKASSSASAFISAGASSSAPPFDSDTPGDYPTESESASTSRSKITAPVVQSSLTTVLRDFRYVDPAGRVWIAAELPPGKKVTLARPRSPKTFREETRGHFRATGGASDLAPLDTLRSIKWTGDTILYTGRVEAAAQP